MTPTPFPWVTRCVDSDGEMMTTRARGETLRSALLSIREHLSHNHCQLKDFFVQEDTLKT